MDFGRDHLFDIPPFCHANHDASVVAGIPPTLVRVIRPKISNAVLVRACVDRWPLGGTLFDIKWLYHSVARQIWHMDRRLWRFFTPHISGGLAFIVLTLISSGLLRVFDQHAIESPSLVLGMTFLVGYFSDSTVAKLAEIADTIFGTTRSTKKQDEQPDAPK